jgi:hypothetical protein
MDSTLEGILNAPDLKNLGMCLKVKGADCDEMASKHGQTEGARDQMTAL